MPQMLMDHVKDPKQEILDQVGDLSDVEVMFSHVLVGVYLRPAKTKGNVILPDQYRDEDLYQGVAMLVLKLGPMAYEDTETVKFNGIRVKPGDWVVIRPSDGWAVNINKQKCRMISDAAIKMKIPSPDLVF